MLPHSLGAGFEHGQAEVDPGLGILGVEAHRRFGGPQAIEGLVVEQQQPGQAGPARRLVGLLAGDGEEVLDHVAGCSPRLVAANGLFKQRTVVAGFQIGVGGGRHGSGTRMEWAQIPMPAARSSFKRSPRSVRAV